MILLHIFFIAQIFDITLQYFRFESITKLQINNHDNNNIEKIYISVLFQFRTNYLEYQFNNIMKDIPMYDHHGFYTNFDHKRTKRSTKVNRPGSFERAEIYIRAINLSRRDLFNRKFFYYFFLNNSDIKYDEFNNDYSKKYSLGYFVHSKFNYLSAVLTFNNVYYNRRNEKVSYFNRNKVRTTL